MRRIKTLVTILRRRGIGYLAYLATGYGLPLAAYLYERSPSHDWLRLAVRGAASLGALACIVAFYLAGGPLMSCLGALFSGLVIVTACVVWKRLLSLSDLAEQPSTVPPSTGFTPASVLGWDEPGRAALAAASSRLGEAEDLLLAKVDAQGRALLEFGPIPGLVPVGRDGFVEPRGGRVDVVLREGTLLLRKDFGGDRARLHREASLLRRLQGRVNVPSLHHVEEGACLLYRNFIPGAPLRQRLDTVVGASDARNPQALTEGLAVALEGQIEAAHAAGAIGISWECGDVLVDPASGAPWLIGLGEARVVRREGSIGFSIHRDAERERFNEVYGRDLLTETGARAALERQSRNLPGWYAPIDFGGGLAVGAFYTIDSGTGRWACINGPIFRRFFEGRRVLDLGSNNGLMPVMMLRSGAREVLGVELSAEYAECANLVRRIFEWKDQQRYPLRIHRGNMLDVLTHDWGSFDVVTAYCSLYYLQPEEMAAVVRKAAELSPVLILQAKSDTRADAEENKSEKSSLRFLRELMEKNGFPVVRTFEAGGFNRPLLIGCRAGVQIALPEGDSISRRAA